MRFWLLVCTAVVVLGLAACELGSNSKIKIGYIGGLSGRYADLGTAGRDGALLAVEMRNLAGGIRDRQLELVTGDDQQDASKARQALDSMAEQGVAGVVGPVTSSMAIALVPRLEETGIVLVGVHTTTTELSGKDDNFFRVIDDTHNYASEVARFHHARRSVRTVAIAYDLANVDYSESWVRDYRRTLNELGGTVVRAIAFDSHYDRKYESMASALVEVEPDMVIIVANAVDTAELAQKVRARNEHVQLAGCGWASTERLLQEGGKLLDGLLLEHYVRQNDISDIYQTFREAFFKRFNREPSFGAAMAFEAANIIMDGLAQAPDPTQLKKTLLSIKRFKGVQGDIVFDENGDVRRSVFFAEVRDGKYSYFK